MPPDAPDSEASWSAIITTRYFRDVVLPRRTYLTAPIVSAVVRTPAHRRVQQDGRIRLWARVPGLGERWVRVVLLDDGATVHNAFLDRDGPPSDPP